MWLTHQYKKMKLAGTLASPLSRTVGAAAPRAVLEAAAAAAPRNKPRGIQATLTSLFSKATPNTAGDGSNSGVDTGQLGSRGVATEQGSGGASDLPNSTAGSSLGPLFGPWHKQGFNFGRLEPGLATSGYKAVGQRRWEVQELMLTGQKTEGILALDHVMEVAKRF